MSKKKTQNSTNHDKIILMHIKKLNYINVMHKSILDI